MSVVWKILIGLVVFGLLIFFHELGHFLLARINKIGVEEFSLGMGPRIFSFERKGIRYSIKALPIGGSCMMVGEDEENDRPDAFNNQPVLRRISVVLAGPVFNFLLAFLLSIVVVAFAGVDKPVLTDTIHGLPAEAAGLQAGDKITRLNDKKITVYRDVTLYMAFYEGGDLRVCYERDGEDYETVITPQYDETYGRYMIGIQVNGAGEPVGFFETLRYAAYEVKYWISYTITSLRLLFTGKVPVSDLSGPVGIVNMIGDTVEASSSYGFGTVLLNLASFATLLSANLGVMNLLPIPALDGGRLLFLLIELIRRKPISREKEAWVHVAGFVLLMLLMVFILYNDIRRLF